MRLRSLLQPLPLGLALVGIAMTAAADDRIQEGELAGYLLVPHSKVPESYDAGFSMYVAAWPLLAEYPGNRFQSGLIGTWMFAQKDGSTPAKGYSDIEGGLGWWRDTRFATATPKFIMGGVALNFSDWANGPGAGKGRDWDKPMGKYGVAQLSPWVVWPPDGLNLKQGTRGELVGYGYLPLPLTEPKTTTDGKKIPTGNQSWTLFLNTANFKGPVAFFTPYFFAHESVSHPQFAGKFLDSRPAQPNKAIQMETQHVPCVLAQDSQGETYARIAPMAFPRNQNGESVLVHGVRAYNRQALWNAVKQWFDGGPEASGVIDPGASQMHTFSNTGGSTWKIAPDHATNEPHHPLAWNSFATPVAINRYTYGYRWNNKLVDTRNGPLVSLPQYFHLQRRPDQKAEWVVVQPEAVPHETGLTRFEFKSRRDEHPEPYVTPEEPNSSWKRPGPAAGPFQIRLGDGSLVTYFWYRFADQPALLNADLTELERETLQKRVERIHRRWKKDRDYLPPPTIGRLAELDPALIVTPPRGLEIGYVPIATRQEQANPKARP